MAGFNDLPNEVVLGVWPHVLGPDDIASFALVSKRVFELGTAFLKEDRRLRSKYTIIKSNRGWDDETLAYLLNDVLTNPHIALYVRHLHACDFLMPGKNPYLEYDSGAEEGLSPPCEHLSSYMAICRNEIRSADYLHPSETKTWIQRLNDGSDEPLLACLLNLLPGLCTLELHGTRFVNKLFTVIYRIIRKSSSESFPRLKSISLSNIPPDKSGGMSLVKMFLLLPSLEKISCYNFLDFPLKRGIPDLIVAPRSSLITELVFDFCGNITHGLSSLLEGIKALKKFTYVLFAARSDVSLLYSALLQHCQYSLEYLKLTRSEWKVEIASFTGTLGSLHSFENLKELDLEFSLMVNPGAGREFAIPDSLPGSIEAIHILGRSEEADQHSLFIRRLVDAKRTELLDLKRLSHRVFDTAEFGKESPAAYTDLCQQCGWHDVIEESE